MKVGFTGTRHPLTTVQTTSLYEVFGSFDDVEELHHGDCVGADAAAHDLAWAHGWNVVIHPPDKPDARAWCKGLSIVDVRPPLPYLVRNHNIVEATEIMVAAPNGPEYLRSGTWATVRFARQIGRPIVIVWPDGTTTKEEARS